MFGLFRPAPEWVHFIDIREGKISVLLPQARKPGDKMRLRFPLSLPAPNNRLDVSVKVTACRPAQGAGYIGIAEPQLDPAETEQLAETLRRHCLAEAREQQTQVRQTDRTRISLRVLGRQIPFYRAVALDLSPGGLKLHCQGPVPVGSVMELCLESDVPGVRDMVIKARVAWTLTPPTTEDTARTCVAGMQFVDVDPRQQAQLQSYLTAVSKREVEGVTHRLVTE